MNFSRIADEADRDRFAFVASVVKNVERLFEIIGHAIAVSGVNAFLDSGLIDFDTEERRTSHTGCEWLCTAHAAQAGSQHDLTSKRAIEVLLGARGEGFERALHDALAPYVDPASGGHLTVHGKAQLFEPTKFIPCCPMRHQLRIADHNTRCILVRS